MKDEDKTKQQLIEEMVKLRLKGNGVELSQNGDGVIDGFKQIVKNSTMCISVKDADGYYLFINEKFKKTFRVSEEMILGKTDFDLLPKEIAEEYRAQDLDILKTGKPLEIENQLNFNGKIQHFILTKSALTNSDGISSAICVTSANITKLRQAEEERLKLEEQLRQSQKMEAIGTLAGGIAHDFNNLLAPILGYTQLTKMSLAPAAKESTYLETIEESAKRAKDLVQKILLISRKTATATVSVQLKNLVEEVLTVLQVSIPANIDIHQEMDFDFPLISADPSQIYQLILNLCTNAVQAMQEGGDLTIKLNKIKRQISSEQENKILEEFICLSVEDSGCGMDSATLERIYDPFFTTKEKGETRGTGLGLSIVSSIVKQHKANIEVESAPGFGTIFRIYFPILKDETNFSAKEPESRVVSGNEHVLLIDDDKRVNEMGRTILQYLGYQVTSFTDSQEALEAFEANPQIFHLVITDYSMPNLTGPQLMKKMKTIRSDIPMLLITGYSNFVTPENIQNWECDGIIAKPYDVKKLSQTINQVFIKAAKNTQLK
ncbi:MAG: response regulator [SAR324 cluster bacterium]|nr:response regulator [SAR324 cluster bacterium]